MLVPTLIKNHVELRPYSLEHIEQTVVWLNQPFIQTQFGSHGGITVQKHSAWLLENEDVLKWAIYAKEYVGNLFLFVNPKHYSAYFQIYLGNQENTGKKIGYHAIQLLLDYAFNHLDLHRIWMHCLPDNIPAIKLYTKLNFSFEGYERESIYRENKFITQGRWSLLKQEWVSKDQSQ